MRVPYFKAGKSLSSRLDLRSPDPACNPYLALAVVFAAGLAGVEEGLELPREQQGNVYELSDEELEEQGIGRLPTDLGRAIWAFERSSLMREVLGDHIFNFIVRAKKAEWTEYSSHVGAWELEAYLPVL